MLNCELCNYLKTKDSKSSNESKCVCEFTGFVFHKNIEDYDIEIHPCYDYQSSKASVKPEKILTNENSKLKIA